MEFGKTIWVKVNSLKRLLDAHKKKTACSRPRFGGAAHLFELNEDKTQPIVLTRLWDRKTVHKWQTDSPSRSRLFCPKVRSRNIQIVHPRYRLHD